MKSFFRTLLDICESIGKARAASHFTRMGDHAAARRIMID